MTELSMKIGLLFVVGDVVCGYDEASWGRRVVPPGTVAVVVDRIHTSDGSSWILCLLPSGRRTYLYEADVVRHLSSVAEGR